ncbi:hypothetical protein [Rhodonellum sp.]|uniref:hypothetical protein n=1 Tax=Rhodonellum sp. TaxID=2231180 RepID=UPI00271BDA46|nr:hypothetical protein [Rhodonellum sp.]MDO9554542.1 hypothetical protein [Rhodonellum sp.]
MSELEKVSTSHQDGVSKSFNPVVKTEFIYDTLKIKEVYFIYNSFGASIHIDGFNYKIKEVADFFEGENFTRKIKVSKLS